MNLAKATSIDNLIKLVLADVKSNKLNLDKDFQFFFKDLLQEELDENDKDLIDEMLRQNSRQLNIFNYFDNLPYYKATLLEDETVNIDGVMLETKASAIEEYIAPPNLIELTDIEYSEEVALNSTQGNQAKDDISQIPFGELDASNQISQTASIDENNIFQFFTGEEAGTNEAVASNIATDILNTDDGKLQVSSKVKIPSETQSENEANSNNQLLDNINIEFENGVSKTENNTEVKEEIEFPQKSNSHSNLSAEKIESPQSYTGESPQKISEDFSHTDRYFRDLDGESQDSVNPIRTIENEHNQIAYHNGNNVSSDEAFEIETSKPMQTQQVFDQIVDKVSLSVSNNIKELKVELKPEFLGKLDIKLIQSHDGIKAKIKVDSLHTENILKTEMTQLIQSLREKDIDIINVDIQNNTLLNDSASTNSFNGFEWKRNNDYEIKLKGITKKQDPEINLIEPQTIISKTKIDCLV